MRKQIGFADVNRTRLYLEVSGEGQPLVLIHGSGLDSRMWDNQFETFAQTYKVIRYDLRGMGKSAAPSGESYAHEDDLNALLEHLNIKSAYVLGLSLGGGVALNFALAYPSATRAVIAVAPSALLIGYRWSAEVLGWLDSVKSAARTGGVQAAKKAWLSLPWFEHALSKPDVASKLTSIISDYSGWHFVNEDPLRIPYPPTIQRLDRITAPTLIIVGEFDSADNHAIAETLLRIPGARKLVMEKVGHICNMEEPHAFNHAVSEFLSSI